MRMTCHNTRSKRLIESLLSVNICFNSNCLFPFTEIRDLFRKWREDNERRSDEVIHLWETVLEEKQHKLDNERHIVLEQVIIAALDCNRVEIAEKCISKLSMEFPGSLRIQKYKAMRLEALELYDEAIEVLNAIISQDETNAAPRKRKVAILKAKGKTAEAIKELCEYTKKYARLINVMVDGVTCQFIL